MSQPQTVEAARVRIQRLVDEIATLSKGEIRSEEYYQQFLTRAVAACDARGGAVWLVGQGSEGKSEFQLAAAVELESSLFQSDEQQRTLLLRALAEVVKSKKPHVIAAENAGPAAPGSLQAQLAPPAPGAHLNKSPYPFVQVPLFLKERVLGVLQVWLQPYVTRENYGEFATFLTQIATHAEQHFQSRQMGSMVVENQRLQLLLKFVSDVTGTLDPVEVSKLTVNYGRDLLACDRCALLRLRGGRWEPLAISGQEVVEKKSTMVKTLASFVTAHTPTEPLTFTPDGANAPDQKAWVIALNKKELLALAEGDGTVPDDRALVLRPHGDTQMVDAAYFEASQVDSLLLAQVLDADKRVIGVLLAESTAVNFFGTSGAGGKDLPGNHRLAEWIAGNAGRALKGAMDYSELPMLFATRRLREVKRGVTGSHRGRYLFKLVLWTAILVGFLFFPWMEEVESDVTLVPEQRVKVVPEIPGRVDEVYVREGNAVKKGDPLARLETSALETDLANFREEFLAAAAEVQKHRALNDPASEQIALTKVRAAEERIKRLERDIAAATLRAPIDGVVLTKDIELYHGVYLNAGTDFAVVGTTEAWDVHVHIHEKEIGKVERLFKEEGSVPVRYILYTHNQHELSGALKDLSQISQIAYPHERENAVKENAFILTLDDVNAPPEVRRGFRPDLTGRASIQLGRRPLIFMWGRNIAQWFRLKWVW